MFEILSDVSTTNLTAKEYLLLTINTLRCVDTRQVTVFSELDKIGKRSTVYKNISDLVSLGYLQKTSYSTQTNYKNVYSLTKMGQEHLASQYNVPKNPFYNTRHTLLLNDYILKSIKLFRNKNVEFRIIPERRILLEERDGMDSKNTKYNVPDFDIEFMGNGNNRIAYHVELELTLKTENRYVNRVMPKYVNVLQRKKHDRVFYICDSKNIYRAIDNISWLFDGRDGHGFQGFHNERLIPTDKKNYIKDLETKLVKDTDALQEQFNF